MMERIDFCHSVYFTLMMTLFSLKESFEMHEMP